MDKTTAINKMISIAQAEVGYLEKASNSNLDDKTANAGSGNYTKYWRDVKPEWNGQAWCACFVTWVLQQAFGKEYAEKLLKHYPYVYVPALMNLFARNANPEKGDIVCFYRNGTFTHTGIVISVSGDYFQTIEGNTSGASGIIANGGGVCQKGYYNSQLPGTKFARLDWSIVADYGKKEEIKMEQKPGDKAYSENRINYRVHQQSVGWLPHVEDGQIAGVTGFSKRIEAIKIDCKMPGVKIKAKGHIQGIGWEDYGEITSDTVIGTTGQEKRLEAISLEAEGLPDGMNIYVRYHIETEGWSDWIKGGTVAGTVGLGKRLEAIQIKIQ